MGEREWAAAKHGGNRRRGWKKLHLGIDSTGEIAAQILTNGDADDGTTGVAIIGDVSNGIWSVTADAAYDTRPIYDAAEGKGAEVVVPPSRKASTSRRERRPRDRAIKRVKEIGRRQWKKESGYHVRVVLRTPSIITRRSSAAVYGRERLVLTQMRHDRCSPCDELVRRHNESSCSISPGFAQRSQYLTVAADL